MNGAVIAHTERDLWQRLDMLPGSDTVVLAGMAAAQVIDASVIAAENVDQVADLTSREVPEEFARFQRLWYHFRVPHAKASLAWWYLFTLAAGRTGGIGAALELMTEWLGQLDGELAEVLPSAAERLGLTPGTVVLTQSETDDVPALVEAVRRNAPMITVSDMSQARRIAADHGITVITSPAPAPGPDIWRGAPPRLRGLSGQARRSWEQLPEAERAELLSMLAQRVTSIEQVRFLVGETPVINRELAKVLDRCAGQAVGNWPEDELALVTTLRTWQVGGYVLQELNQSYISLPALALFLCRRIREYSARIGGAPPAGVLTGMDLLDLARLLGELRGRVEKEYERCLHFDGSNWERREFLLPQSLMQQTHDVPPGLRDTLRAWTGAEFPGDSGRLEAWDDYVERVLEAGGTPTRILQAMAQWCADAPDLPIDIAVFTVPIGCKLDEPWNLDFTDLFCYCGFRTGFRPKDSGIATGLVGIQNIMGQRMRYNAVKKAQNYAPVRRFPPQGFNLPDISIAEDANHAGHAAAGVRLACRVPLPVSYRGKVWNGIADVRLNRADYHSDNRFRPRDLIVANRYGQWTKGVADATYRRNLTFDLKWGNKVTDMEL